MQALSHRGKKTGNNYIKSPFYIIPGLFLGQQLYKPTCDLVALLNCIENFEKYLHFDTAPHFDVSIASKKYPFSIQIRVFVSKAHKKLGFSIQTHTWLYRKHIKNRDLRYTSTKIKGGSHHSMNRLYQSGYKNSVGVRRRCAHHDDHDRYLFGYDHCDCAARSNCIADDGIGIIRSKDVSRDQRGEHQT